MDESDLRFTRLVARHYFDMQGLRPVVVGLGVLPSVLAYVVYNDDTVAVLAMGAGMLAAIWCMPLVERYYAREFGRIEQAGQLWRNVWMGASMAGLMLDEHFAGWPSLFCLSWGTMFAWTVWDCWPERRYYLLLVAIALFGAITHTRVPTIVPFKTWFAQTMTLFSAALVVTGFADHTLMRRIFRKTGPAPDAESI